jgi:hypothetical protein
MPKTSPTKPGEPDPIPGDTPPPTHAASQAIEPAPTAIRAATTGSESPSPIPDLLQRITDIEAQLSALLDDLAVAIPDLRAPAPIPTSAPSPSGAYALQPAASSLDTLRERAATGDRAALLHYLRLRRS